ncbi:MAG: phospholipid carrier-dependent glycosyltransferase [Desulfamplus sp.]|nr:phospholipid carrier-dependent glycosyltransferase [Desulfamplus sp.]
MRVIKNNNLFAIGVIFIGLLIILATVLLASVPPVDRDALIHHLAIPKLYLKAGKIIDLPCMEYSYYPMNLDMLYMVSLYFGSDIAPKFIHFSFALFTAFLVFQYLNNRLNRLYALLGSILFLSIPIIVKLSITVYVDLGLVFFSTASLLAILKCVENGFKVKYILIAGAACGLAMGTKYNGLITFLLLSLLVPFLYSRFSKDKSQNKNSLNSSVKSIAWAFIFVFSAFVIFSPWTIRNYIWTKNPLYPFYNSVFTSKIENPCVISKFTEDSGATGLGILGYRMLLYEENWWETAFLPIRIFFQGEDNNPKYFDGRLSPLLLIFSIFAFIAFNKKKELYDYEKNVFLAFAALFFFFAFFSTELRIRYFAPSIPPLVILSVYGVKNLVEEALGGFIVQSQFRAGVIKRALPLAVLIVGAAYMIISTAGYFAEQFKTVKPLEYLSGKISRDDYIASFRYEYPAMQYINKKLPPDATVLFFYLGGRGYYCDRNYIPDSGNSVKMLYNMISSIQSDKDVRSFFKQVGITHFLINNAIFMRSLGANINTNESNAISLFMHKHAKKLFDEKGYSIFQLN